MGKGATKSVMLKMETMNAGRRHGKMEHLSSNMFLAVQISNCIIAEILKTRIQIQCYEGKIVTSHLYQISQTYML